MLRWLGSIPFGAVALLVVHAGWAQEQVRHIPLDQIDQLRLNMISILTKAGCDIDYGKIATSIKFILNSANIPFVVGYPELDDPPPNSPEEKAKRNRQWKMPGLLVSGDVLPIKAGCIYGLEVRCPRAWHLPDWSTA